MHWQTELDFPVGCIRSKWNTARRHTIRPARTRCTHQINLAQYTRDMQMACSSCRRERTVNSRSVEIAGAVGSVQWQVDLINAVYAPGADSCLDSCNAQCLRHEHGVVNRLDGCWLCCRCSSLVVCGHGRRLVACSTCGGCLVLCCCCCRQCCKRLECCLGFDHRLGHCRGVARCQVLLEVLEMAEPNWLVLMACKSFCSCRHRRQLADCCGADGMSWNGRGGAPQGP
jgi:hypothetical protein